MEPHIHQGFRIYRGRIGHRLVRRVGAEMPVQSFCLDDTITVIVVVSKTAIDVVSSKVSKVGHLEGGQFSMRHMAFLTAFSASYFA